MRAWEKNKENIQKYGVNARESIVDMELAALGVHQYFTIHHPELFDAMEEKLDDAEIKRRFDKLYGLLKDRLTFEQ